MAVLQSPTIGNNRSSARGREAIKFFTIPEVAECLNVSTRTVRRWIAKGMLVAHRFDGIVRIAERDLRAFLGQHREG
jgi:excisionase family DNA binding protein